MSTDPEFLYKLYLHIESIVQTYIPSTIEASVKLMTQVDERTDSDGLKEDLGTIAFEMLGSMEMELVELTTDMRRKCELLEKAGRRFAEVANSIKNEITKPSFLIMAGIAQYNRAILLSKGENQRVIVLTQACDLFTQASRLSSSKSEHDSINNYQELLKGELLELKSMSSNV